ncbi:paraquat-inducible protein [Geomonas silvestris]|uniref:Paraquat-inducible protein n=1 Tax=Geomonas silvestris TaxID=2740184 RepID=A0A6V8MD73_9BACT|nr:paraquat-inducible protein A [Geomonas silvestris]GFO57896.1 paraquat-inducible protein [Geomonas silvestris]
MSEHAPLIACHDCDLLQREIPLNPGCAATCPRCGAVLYRNATDSVNRTLAYSVGAALVFLIANWFPIFGIEAQGTLKGITLLDAVRSLWDQEMQLVSTVVFITAIVIPALEILSLVYLLLPLQLGMLPSGYNQLLRLMRLAEPWGMVEVFMLGILVSLVKLTGNFRVVPGVALWSFAVLTLLIAAAAASFSTRDVWCCVDRITGRKVAP